MFLSLEKTFELRMVLHKIQQINAPLRFTNVVLVCLVKVTNISSEQQKCIYLYRQNYTIINQNWQNHIPLNARSWNDLKRSLDGSLKEIAFMGAIPPCISLLGYHQSQGWVRTQQNSNQSFHEFRTVLLLSANIGHAKYKISTFPEVIL